MIFGSSILDGDSGLVAIGADDNNDADDDGSNFIWKRPNRTGWSQLKLQKLTIMFQKQLYYNI